MGRTRGDAVADHRRGGGRGLVLARLRCQRLRRPFWCAHARRHGGGGLGRRRDWPGDLRDRPCRRWHHGQRDPGQIAEWLPLCFEAENGKINLAAFGVSEPDAGSDVSSLRSRAVYDEANDEWILNGTKTWITNGGIADVHVLVLSVDPALRSRGQAAFVVPPGTQGLRQGQKFKKHGIRASHT